MSVHRIDCLICGDEFIVTAKYNLNDCPKCGQRYVWTESYEPVLSERQLAALKQSVEPQKPTGPVHYL